MKTLSSWAEEHWDALAIALALTGGLLAGTGLSVAYNVLATRPAPTMQRAAPYAPPQLEADPLRPGAPYS